MFKLHNILLLLFLLFSIGSQAQTTSTPAPDDPELLVGFLHLVTLLDVQAAAEEDPTKARAIAFAMRHETGLTESDFRIVLAEGIREKSTVAAGEPNGTHLTENDRTAMATASQQRLIASMSRSGWAKLHAYINGVYRQRTVKFSVPLKSATTR